jgi:hypothetical protein
MREFGTSGSVGGEGGNLLAYPATMNSANLLTKWYWIVELARRKLGTVLFSLNHVIDFEWMREAYTNPQGWGNGHRRCNGEGV